MDEVKVQCGQRGSSYGTANRPTIEFINSPVTDCFVAGWIDSTYVLSGCALTNPVNNTCGTVGRY